MIKDKLGSKLKQFRKHKNLKQSEIAKLLNLSVKTIQRYEKGLNIPYNFIEEFCVTLNLDDNQSKTLFSLFFDNNTINGDELIYSFEKVYNLLGYYFDYQLINGRMKHILLTNNKQYVLHNNFLEEKIILLSRILDTILFEEIREIPPIEEV